MAVVICYDGSDSAKRAIGVAHSILGHRPAVLLHVWNPPEQFLAGAFGIQGGGTPSLVELEASAEAWGEHLAAEGYELARHAGFAVEARVERAGESVSRTILDTADELDAELIVVGTRGRTAVRSALLGSVANSIVHHSRRATLVIPALASEAPAA